PLAATPSQSVRAGPGMRHIGAMAGIAAIAVAAAAGVWWFSGAPPNGVSATEMTKPPEIGSAPAPASEPSFSAGDATASVSTAPVEPATDRPASVAPASTKTRAASPAGGAPQDDRNTVSAPESSITKRESNSRSTAKASASVPVAADPEAACSGRILLGYQLCLNEQCARPIFGSHPLCEQRRAAEQALRQQQANRN
ncbi:MAG: hypothetical protein ABIR55_09295, partial [Burkholderiaceae bacterium]